MQSNAIYFEFVVSHRFTRVCIDIFDIRVFISSYIEVGSFLVHLSIQNHLITVSLLSRSKLLKYIKLNKMAGNNNPQFEFQTYQREYSLVSLDGEDPPTCYEKVKSQFSTLYTSITADMWLLMATVVLIVNTATERVTFKMMVDRMLPYKFVLIDIIFLASCAIFSAISYYKQRYTDEITPNMKLFPHKWILGIAFVDSVQFLWSVYSAIGVSPTMTVILMHASTLFIVMASRVVTPSRSYGKLHSIGVVFISVAIFLSLFKIIYNDYYFSSNDSRWYTTKSAFLYLIASALQGLSTLMKEKALVEWSQPIDIYYLSSWLFFYQFLITVMFSVLFYLYEAIFGIQGSIWRSFYYGWNCFLGFTPSASSRDDDSIQFINCNGSFILITTYVFATFAVLAAINVVLQYSSQVVGRAVSAAILTAFLALWMYDLYESRAHPSNYIFGGKVGLFDVVAVIILVIGMEIYSRDPEPDVELLTQHSPKTGSERDEEAPLALKNAPVTDGSEVEIVPRFVPIGISKKR